MKVVKSIFFCKAFLGLVLMIMSLTFSQTVFAQPPALPDTSRMTFDQISKGLNITVFPANKQSRQQQKEDEFECYRWGMERSGVDPLNLPKVQAAPVPSGPTGAAVGGAARGAAAGLAIGAVAGNAGRGAAIGATAGAIGGRRAGQQAQAQQRQQSQANASSKEREIWNSFVNAFAACMEGKGYTVR
jgi:Glycine zipper